MLSKWKEILEIGSKAADNQGGHDETRALEWQSCGSVGEGKRHYENYDGFAGAWVIRAEAVQLLELIRQQTRIIDQNQEHCDRTIQGGRRHV